MTEFATELSSNGNSANVMLRQDTKSNLHTSQSLEDISVLAKLIFTSYHHKYTAHFVVDTIHLVLSHIYDCYFSFPHHHQESMTRY